MDLEELKVMIYILSGDDGEAEPVAEEDTTAADEDDEESLQETTDPQTDTTDPQTIMNTYDANKDGKLSMEELPDHSDDDAGALKEAMTKADKDGDGLMDLEELKVMLDIAQTTEEL